MKYTNIQPDIITLLALFIRGYMKERIFATLNADVKELKAKMQPGVFTVT